MPIEIKLFDIGSSIGYWDFVRDIPLFKIVERVNGKNWKNRLKEEFEKLDYLKSLAQQNVIFDTIEHDLKNNKIFNCAGHFPSGKKITFNIRLPVRYPASIPIAENFYIRDWYVGLNNFKAACFGRMKEKWRQDGRYGLAHFLVMLAHYTAMAAFSINTPKSKKPKKIKKKKKTKQKTIK
ncbi:MAG: hypothetical protein ACTSRG_00300 [Candidatus Helarchaeota archaeon]